MDPFDPKDNCGGSCRSTYGAEGAPSPSYDDDDDDRLEDPHLMMSKLVQNTKVCVCGNALPFSPSLVVLMLLMMKHLGTGLVNFMP